jgi:hypothetical protein
VRTKLAADFEAVGFRPAVEGGRHDIHLLRKPARVAVAAEHS